MTLDKLASLLAKMEGKKVQVSVGNIREILRLLTAIDAAYRVKQVLEGGSTIFTPGEALALIGSNAAAKAEKYLKTQKPQLKEMKKNSIVKHGVALRKLKTETFY